MSAIENRYESYYGSYDKSKDLLESLSSPDTGAFRTFMKQVESRYKNIDFFYTLFNKYKNNPQTISNLIINIVNKFSTNENFSKTQKINLLRTIGIALTKMDTQNNFGQKVLSLLETPVTEGGLKRLEMGSTYKELLVLTPDEVEKVQTPQSNKSDRLLNIYWRERANITTPVSTEGGIDKDYKEKLITEKELDTEKDEFVPGATRTALLGMPYHVFGSIYEQGVVKDKDYFWGMIHMYKNTETGKFKNTIGLWKKQEPQGDDLVGQIKKDYYVSTTKDVKGMFLDSRGLGKNYFKILNDKGALSKLLKRNLYIPFKKGVTSPLERVEGETPKRAKNREILISILNNAKSRGILKIKNSDLKDFFAGKALGVQSAKSRDKQSMSYELLFKVLIESPEFKNLYPTHHQFLQSIYSNNQFDYRSLKNEDHLEMLAETIFLTASIFSGGDITATASNSEELTSFENKFLNGDTNYFTGYYQIRSYLDGIDINHEQAGEAISNAEAQVQKLEKYLNTVIHNSSDLLTNPEVKKFADGLKTLVTSLRAKIEIKKALVQEKQIRLTMQQSEDFVIYTEPSKLRSIGVFKGIPVAKEYDAALKKYADKKQISDPSALSKDQKAEFDALFKVYFSNKKLGFYFDGEKYTAISKIYVEVSELEQKSFFKNPAYAEFEKSADMQCYFLRNNINARNKSYAYTSIDEPAKKIDHRALSNTDALFFEKNIGNSETPEKANLESLQFQIDFYNKAFKEVSEANKQFATHYSKDENLKILNADTDNGQDDLNLGVKKFGEHVRKEIYSKNRTANKELNSLIVNLAVGEINQVKEALPEGFPRPINLKPHRDDSSVVIPKERLQIGDKGRDISPDGMDLDRKRETLRKDEETTFFLEAIKNGKREEAKRIADRSGDSDYSRLFENNKTFEECLDSLRGNLLTKDARKAFIKDVHFDDPKSPIQQQGSDNKYTQKANRAQATLIKELELFNSSATAKKGNVAEQLKMKDYNNAQIEFSKTRTKEIGDYEILIGNAFGAQQSLISAREKYMGNASDENYQAYKTSFKKFMAENKKVNAFKFQTSKTVGTHTADDGKGDRVAEEQKKTTEILKAQEQVEAAHYNVYADFHITQKGAKADTAKVVELDKNSDQIHADAQSHYGLHAEKSPQNMKLAYQNELVDVGLPKPENQGPQASKLTGQRKTFVKLMVSYEKALKKIKEIMELYKALKKVVDQKRFIGEGFETEKELEIRQITAKIKLLEESLDTIKEEIFNRKHDLNIEGYAFDQETKIQLSYLESKIVDKFRVLVYEGGYSIKSKTDETISGDSQRTKTEGGFARVAVHVPKTFVPPFIAELSVYGNQTRALAEESYTGTKSDGSTISKTPANSKPSTNVGGSVVATWYQLNNTLKELSIGVAYDFSQTYSRSIVVGSKESVVSASTTTPPPFNPLSWGGSTSYTYGYSSANTTNPLFQNPPGQVSVVISSTSTDGQPASNANLGNFNFGTPIPITFGQSGAGPVLTGFIKPAGGFSATTNITFNIPYYTGVITNGVAQVANYPYTISYSVTNPGGVPVVTPLPRPAFAIPPINESVYQPPIDVEKRSITQRLEVSTNMKLNLIKGKNEKGEDDPKALSKLLLDFTFATQFGWQNNRYTADTETARQYLITNGIITPDENSFDVKFLTEMMLNYRLGALNLLGGLGTRDLIGNEDSHYFKLGASIRFSDLFQKQKGVVSPEGWDFLMSATYTSTLKQTIAWAKGDSSGFDYNASARFIAEYTPISKKYFEKVQAYVGAIQNHTRVAEVKPDVNSTARIGYTNVDTWLGDVGFNLTNILGSDFDFWFKAQIPLDASITDTYKPRGEAALVYRPKISATDRDQNEDRHAQAMREYRQLIGKPFSLSSMESDVMTFMENSKNHDTSFVLAVWKDDNWNSNAEKLRNALIEIMQKTRNEEGANRRNTIKEFLTKKLFIRYPKLDKNIDHV